MSFHPKFAALFSDAQLSALLAAAAIVARNDDGEIYSILLDSDTVYAEIYADHAKADVALIMDFHRGPLTAESFWAAFQRSTQFETVRVWDDAGTTTHSGTPPNAT